MVYLAAAGSKRYFTGVNPIYTANEVAFQMKTSAAAVVLIHPSLLDIGIAAAKQACIPLDRLFIFSETEYPMTKGVLDWRSIVVEEKDADSWQWDPLDGEAAVQTTAVINFSSGTTGLPKGVSITHYNLVANTCQAIFNNAIGIGLESLQSQRWLGFLPLYHAYSQLFTINVACKLEIGIYMMPKFSFEDYLKYIQQFKITAVQTVPPVLVMMAKRKETSRYDLSSLQHILTGAAPLSSGLQNEVMSRFGMIVCQAWGMTETTCAGIMTPGMTKDATGSIGNLLPNTEACLVDENGRQITGEGEPGELWLKGPQVLSSYWENESATRESIVSGGWFMTGDVAVTRGGKWWIVDRKKELIKVNGLQVAPAELEAVLLEHPSVADAAAVGITIHGEEFPRAYVVLKDGTKDQKTAKGIQDFVSRKVAKHKRLSGGVQFVDEVPKLASGKIVRKELKKWAKRDAKAVGGKIKARF
ncbi:Fc.00g093350.m01.CDS01 [Cosmosporella sp. VM-42]